MKRSRPFMRLHPPPLFKDPRLRVAHAMGTTHVAGATTATHPHLERTRPIVHISTTLSQLFASDNVL